MEICPIDSVQLSGNIYKSGIIILLCFRSGHNSSRSFLYQFRRFTPRTMFDAFHNSFLTTEHMMLLYMSASNSNSTAQCPLTSPHLIQQLHKSKSYLDIDLRALEPFPCRDEPPRYNKEDAINRISTQAQHKFIHDAKIKKTKEDRVPTHGPK